MNRLHSRFRWHITVVVMITINEMRYAIVRRHLCKKCLPLYSVVWFIVFLAVLLRCFLGCLQIEGKRHFDERRDTSSVRIRVGICILLGFSFA